VVSQNAQDIHVSPSMTDDERRAALFKGDLVVLAKCSSSSALCAHAAELVSNAFAPLDPLHAQESLEVEQFIEIVTALKSEFTNGHTTKLLVQSVLEECGVDPDRTYFDVPRIRVVPHSSYLTAGVAYAYQAHRDTWYSSPASQVNWWLSVFDGHPSRGLTFYPNYRTSTLVNSSSEFDYDEWVANGRQQASRQVRGDARKHPLPTTVVDHSHEIRFGLSRGDALLFSATQLHATVPNTSSETRFSIDFRTVNLDDLETGRGGWNMDSGARGTTLGDFISARTLGSSPLDHVKVSSD
jgi:hypothetical protein